MGHKRPFECRECGCELQESDGIYCFGCQDNKEKLDAVIEQIQELTIYNQNKLINYMKKEFDMR